MTPSLIHTKESYTRLRLSGLGGGACLWGSEAPYSTAGGWAMGQ